MSREAPHKQGDQGGSPQAELRPGSPPTTRITTRELAVAGWLAGGISKLASWLAVGLAGWLAKAQKGRERPREAQRGTETRSVDRTSPSCAWLRRWGLPTSRFMTREARHRVLVYVTPGEAPTMYHYVCMYVCMYVPRAVAGWLAGARTYNSQYDRQEN